MSAERPPRPPRILIVDDEEDNVELLAIILSWEGFVIAKASNGEDALARVAETRPDLILLDVMMPGLTGYEVLAILKGDVATKHIPVMMVSAMLDAKARTRAFSDGAADCLLKPLERALLVVRVKALLFPDRT